MKKASRIFIYIIVCAVIASILFPFIWMILSSIKPAKELFLFPPTIWPKEFIFENYISVWENIPLMKYFINTVIFAGGVTVISLMFDSMAGYAFARLNFKFKEPLFIGILITMMIPFQVIMIPLFVEVYKLGILDSYLGLILPRATSAFGIYMMRSFFVSLPKDLEEAARVDGLNEYRIFWNIMLPLCKPAFVTLGIIILMNNWNDLLYPMMLTSSTEMRTLSAGLAMFVGDKVIEYGPMLAASALSILPLFVLYLSAQKYFIEGVATSGLK